MKKFVIFKQYTYIESLRQHITTHNNETVSCDVCSKPIKKSSLKAHMMRHDKRKFPCSICKLESSTFVDMTKHVKNMSPLMKMNWSPVIFVQNVSPNQT